MIPREYRDHYVMASITDVHAYLLALSLPHSDSLTTVAAHFEQSDIPPFVRKVLALLAPKGQGDA